MINYLICVMQVLSQPDLPRFGRSCSLANNSLLVIFLGMFRRKDGVVAPLFNQLLDLEKLLPIDGPVNYPVPWAD